MLPFYCAVVGQHPLPISILIKYLPDLLWGEHKYKLYCLEVDWLMAVWWPITYWLWKKACDWSRVSIHICYLHSHWSTDEQVAVCTFLLLVSSMTSGTPGERERAKQGQLVAHVHADYLPLICPIKEDFSVCKTRSLDFHSAKLGKGRRNFQRRGSSLSLLTTGRGAERFHFIS